MSLLPAIATREEYTALFPRAEIWEPAVREIARRHSLRGELRRGELGSHVVFRAGDAWIKLIFPLWRVQAAMEAAGLRTVSGCSFSTPRLIAEGELEGWPYLVLSHVDGKRIGDVWKTSDRPALARSIARVTRELQGLAPAPEVSARLRWNDFIDERFAKCLARHESLGMAVDDLRRLERLLSRARRAEYHCPSPVFLHADLTHDHFLVNGDRVSGVIDFADCRAGHPEYDTIAYFTYLFAGDAAAQEAFYAEWGSRIEPERMLLWCALHEFSDLHKNWGSLRRELFF